MVANKQKQIELSVVIPAYNEAKRLPKTLRKLRYQLRNMLVNFEIIVVDDGSIDKTSYLVKQVDGAIRLIRHQTNHGKGEAVRIGILAARGKFILMTDADNSVPIEQLSKLWRYRKRNNLVIGSRFLTGSRFVTKSKRRMILSKLGNTLFRILFKIPVYDTQCGFKLFSGQTGKKLFKQLATQGFGFDMEIIVKAKRLGFKIKEVPVDWYDAPGSSVRAGSAAWQTLKELIAFYLTVNSSNSPEGFKKV